MAAQRRLAPSRVALAAALFACASLLLALALPAVHAEAADTSADAGASAEQEDGLDLVRSVAQR